MTKIREDKIQVENVLFKDKREMNHKTNLEDSLKEIAKLLNNLEGDWHNDSNLIKTLLGDAATDVKQNPDHSFCDGCETNRMTEKRLCRCMYYYNEPEKRKKSNCSSCKLRYKWKNVGNISIVEYEYPTSYVIKTVGGMDLIIIDEGQEYAVEVKPKYSKETLARMFAEILTYTIEYKNGERKPAICFFEGSEQWNEYFDFKKYKRETIDIIEEYIKIYYFEIVDEKNANNEREFKIRPISDANVL